MKKTLLILAVFLWSGLQIALAQSRPIRGKVTDANGKPVEAASVSVKDAESVSITDENGNFEIDVPDDKNVIVVEAIGFNTREVDAGDGDNALNVSLEVSDNTLGETVIIGYGTTTYKQLIGGSSVVKEQAFANKPMGSFTNMLQGQAAGVQITGQNGAPGATAFIRIRGTSSISGDNQPLVVIDGIPSTTEALNSLNNNDILDVTILKDASTTSIYGSRGANGVVVVTTKKGKSSADNRPRISYGFQYGWKTKTSDKYNMMDFDQKLQWEARSEVDYTNQYLVPYLQEDGYNSITEVPEGERQKYWDKLRPYATNWLSQKKGENPILRVGKYQQHDLTVSGSDDKFSYYLSGQLYSEDGPALASFFDKKAGNMKLEYNATKWLKVGQSLIASYTEGREVRDRFNVQNPFAAMYFYNPYESPYDFSGGGINGYNLTVQGFNLVEATQNNPDRYNNMYMMSNTYLEIKPIENLTIRTQLGMQYNDRQHEAFTKPGSILDLILNGQPYGSKTDDGYNRFNYVWTNTAEYKKTFNNDHIFSALIGTEFTKEKYKGYEIRSDNFPIGVSTQENSGKPTTTSTDRYAWTLMSYFGRLQYSYKGKYSANFSLRSDGSSRFGLGNKYGTFVAGGASWLLSDEEFLRNVNGINYLKLWGSIGTSGSNSIGNYTHLPYFGYSPYDNTPSAYPANIGNESLSWEKSLTGSFGLDYGFWNNRIIGTIDYYNRKTYELLLRKPISPTVGFTDQTQNIGSMKNSGVEFSISADVIRNKNVIWTVGGNFTYNKNKVLDLGGADTIPSYSSYLGYYVKGHPLDVYMMQRYAGYDKESGAALWYMKDGSTTDDYSQADLFILEGKAPDPKFYGGFFTNVNYKGFELGINFSYSGGNWTYNNQWMQANLAANYYQNLAEDFADYWTPEHTNAKNPALDFNDNLYDSDRWLEKANYIRLRNITLAYNFPVSWFDNKIQGLRVYVQGQNLWYNAKGYHGDPEVGIGSDETDLTRVGNTSLYSYPQSKAITFGLNVSF